MFPSPVSVRQCQGPGTHSHPPSITDPPPQLPPIIGKDVREDRPTRSPLRATPVHLYSKVLPPVRNAGTFPHLSTGSRNLVRRPRPRQHLPCPSLLTSRWTLLLPTLALSGHPGQPCRPHTTTHGRFHVGRGGTSAVQTRTWLRVAEGCCSKFHLMKSQSGKCPEHIRTRPPQHPRSPGRDSTYVPHVSTLAPTRKRDPYTLAGVVQ